LARCCYPSPCQGRMTLSTQAHPCGPLFPILCICNYLSSHHILVEWLQVSVTAMYGGQLWMCARPFLCIDLDIVGITAESRESGRMGGHPHVQMLSSPPFVGVVLRCICGSGRLMSVHNPLGPPLLSTAPPSVCA
jgi:hypothetical protein